MKNNKSTQKKYAIIGGGISGLSIANLLKLNHDVTIFESDSRPGGMVKCDIINGSLFHRTGGHVFNTKREDVMNWFWSFFDKENQFTKAVRNSAIIMQNGVEIPYPIENHAYLLDKYIGINIVKDLLFIDKNQKIEPANFEEFLKCRFGLTLYNLYFQPYNLKVWRRDLSKVPLSWLEGKLPMPSVEEIIYNNIYHVKESSFVHSSFYYPQRGGSQFLADNLSRGLNIRYNKKIDIISKTNNRFLVDGEEFDIIIFCGNIKQLPYILPNSIDISGYISAIENLKFHGTTTVFCEIDKNPYSWIYLPSSNYESHRIICTGNFSPTNNVKGKMTGTIEFTDYISKEIILKNLSKMPLSPKYITHHFEQYTYPIQDINTRQMIQNLKNILEKNNIFLCGRFAEWEYANMDICMGSAIDLHNKLLKLQTK